MENLTEQVYTRLSGEQADALAELEYMMASKRSSVVRYLVVDGLRRRGLLGANGDGFTVTGKARSSHEVNGA